MRVKHLEVHPPLLLAPMAEITNLAFRRLLRKLGGVGLWFSEMLSSKAVVVEKYELSPILWKDPEERPFFYQIVGSDPEKMAAAAEKLLSFGADGIDINMGCSFPPIVREKAGVYLMKEPELAIKIVRSVRKRNPALLSVKMRLGWEKDPDKLLSFAKALEDEGVDFITLHPRIKDHRFTGKADWNFVRLLKENLSIPVVGNGDIFTVEDAEKKLSASRADAIMLGRGAVRDPLLFRKIAEKLFGLRFSQPPPSRKELISDYIEELLKIYPENIALKRLKLFTYYFSQAEFWGHRLWKMVQNSSSLSEARSAIESYYRG